MLNTSEKNLYCPGRAEHGAQQVAIGRSTGELDESAEQISREGRVSDKIEHRLARDEPGLPEIRQRHLDLLEQTVPKPIQRLVAGVAETTTQPIILSHSNIQDARGWARLISPEHARLVANTGGIIGAMPIIFGRHGDDIGGYVDYVSRLVDVVGIDHVGLGTDMDGIGPGAIFTSYARWPSLAVALLDHGYGRGDVAKVLGCNAQRVFRKVHAASRPS